MTGLSHPEEVAALVRGTGAAEHVVQAALLHDAVEDTNLTVDAIRAEHGEPVAAIVEAMTEDASIDDYGERKAEARLRARDAGRETALVFVADKLSNVRRMKRGEKEPDSRKIAHYAETAALMRAAYPDLPLLDDLDAELA